MISNKQSVLDNKVVHGEARPLVQALTQCPFSFLPRVRTITADWVARQNQQLGLNRSAHLEGISGETSGGHGKGTGSNRAHGSSGKGFGGCRLGRAASSLVGRGGGGMAGSRGGGGGCGSSGSIGQAANLGNGGRVVGGAKLLDVALALVLAICVASVGLDAVGEELLADEGGQSLGVILETRSRVVGSACAVEGELSLVAVVQVSVVVAKDLASVGLALAPNSSLLLGNRVRVNGHVQRALVGRNSLSRHRSSGNGDEDGRGSHFRSWFG